MESLAAGRRRARAKKFNPKPFVDRIDQLMAASNISMRQSGVDSGLDHETIRRVKDGKRVSCKNLNRQKTGLKRWQTDHC